MKSNERMADMDDQKETTAGLRLHATTEAAAAESLERIADVLPEVDPGILFAIIPDDETRTMTLSPMGEGETAIKLTEKTAKILIAMLDRQIQEWL